MKIFNKDTKRTLIEDAREIRRTILELAYSSGGGQHLGGGLSMIEIMCYLYGFYLNINPLNKKSLNRDRFILSKGHGVLGFYPVLNKYQLISDDILKTYKKQDSELISHPIKNLDYGIESSNGSLGHGLSYGIGVAHALNIKSIKAKVVVLVGDGECNEGSIWEAAMSASAISPNNLTCIVDNNKLQSDGATKDIINCNSLFDKWKAFGWEVIEIDGHNFSEINDAFNQKTEIPKLILAHTIKGKGITFMESNNEWHHGRLTERTFNEAMMELK